MAFRAEIGIGGKVFDVLYSDFSLNRDVNQAGKPASGVYGGTLQVRVESTADTSLIEAMVNSQFKPFDGVLTYKKTGEDSTMKTVEFKNSYIVKYKETLDVTGETPMTILFTISAEEIIVGNATHFNRWAKSS